jgi:8-oxo-dGTP diphosphatase
LRHLWVSQQPAQGFALKMERQRKESIHDSAERTLMERTGLQHIFLQQFYAFGDPSRERGKRPFSVLGRKSSWITKRFITIGYYALVEFSKVNPQPDSFSDECRWWDVEAIPKLIYDHNDIAQRALETLRDSLNNHPVGFNLLPKKFTMPELQRLYETILNKELDRRNFQKKMLSLGILTRLNERKTGGAHKAPFLYQFNARKYHQAVRDGLQRDW